MRCFSDWTCQLTLWQAIPKMFCCFLGVQGSIVLYITKKSFNWVNWNRIWIPCHILPPISEAQLGHCTPLLAEVCVLFSSFLRSLLVLSCRMYVNNQLLAAAARLTSPCHAMCVSAAGWVKAVQNSDACLDHPKRRIVHDVFQGHMKCSCNSHMKYLSPQQTAGDAQQRFCLRHLRRYAFIAQEMRRVNRAASTVLLELWVAWGASMLILLWTELAKFREPMVALSCLIL